MRMFRQEFFDRHNIAGVLDAGGDGTIEMINDICGGVTGGFEPCLSAESRYE